MAILALLGSLFYTQTASAEDGKIETKEEKHWYDKIKVKGYTQFRYSRLLESNPNLHFDSDKSVGDHGGFLLRRARLVFYGDVNDHLYLYFQPGFISNVDGHTNYVSLRDWYGDISIDKKKEFRFRVGQSKIPYGFENLQSSSNRAPLERSDAINSATPGERDLGVVFYYTPEEISKRFSHLKKANLKGSGNYGLLGVGVFNGQAANLAENNNSRGVVLHGAYPFKIGKQYIETGYHIYYSDYKVKTDDKVVGDPTSTDLRFAKTLVIYPQPLGFQFEYNVGKGPELSGDKVVSKSLHGGYAMLLYKHDVDEKITLFPFVRGAYYEGGKKAITNSPHHSIREFEQGLEFQYDKWLELTAALNESIREINYKSQAGYMARLQVQFVY